MSTSEVVDQQEVDQQLPAAAFSMDPAVLAFWLDKSTRMMASHEQTIAMLNQELAATQAQLAEARKALEAAGGLSSDPEVKTATRTARRTTARVRK